MDCHTLSAELTATFDELRGLLSAQSSEQLNTRPFPGSWTAAQVGEHLLKSYESDAVIFGNTLATNLPADEKTAEVEALFLDMSIKMQSPKEVLPSESPIDKEYLLAGIEAKKQRFLLACATLDLSRTCTDFEIMEYGPFTRFEWLFFTLVHTKRHVQQLKNMTTLVSPNALASAR